MCSKGWGFRKAGTQFPYFLFLVSYSFCVLAPLRALRETKPQTINNKPQTFSQRSELNP